MIFAYLLPIFFPFFCVCCKKEGALVCKGCLAGVTAAPVWVQEARCWSFYRFSDGWVRKVLHALKYLGVQSVAELLVQHACNCGACTVTFSQGVSYVWVPIPISAQRRKVRGYNQAELIARAFQKQFGGTVLPDALRKAHRASLVGKTKAERSALARTAFSASPDVTVSGFVVLVDDLVTTGATLSAAREVLESVGVTVNLTIALAYED